MDPPTVLAGIGGLRRRLPSRLYEAHGVTRPSRVGQAVASARIYIGYQGHVRGPTPGVEVLSDVTSKAASSGWWIRRPGAGAVQLAPHSRRPRGPPATRFECC